MPTVPRYTPGQQGITPLPDSSVAPPAITQSSSSLLEAGNILGTFLQERAEKKRKVNTQNALNAYRQSKLDLLYGEEGLFTKQGQEFIDSVPEVIADLRNSQNSVLSSGGDVDVGSLQAFFTEDNLKEIGSLRKASIKAEFEIEKAASIAERSLLTNEAVNDPTLFETNANQLVANVEEFLSSNGVEVSEANKLSVLGKYADEVVGNLIDNQAFDLANELLQADVAIPGVVRTKLANQLKDAVAKELPLQFAATALEMHPNNQQAANALIKELAGDDPRLYLKALEEADSVYRIDRFIAQEARSIYSYQRRKVRDQEEDQQKGIVDIVFAGYQAGQITDMLDIDEDTRNGMSKRTYEGLQTFFDKQNNRPPTQDDYRVYSELALNPDRLVGLSTDEVLDIVNELPASMKQPLIKLSLDAKDEAKKGLLKRNTDAVTNTLISKGYGGDEWAGMRYRVVNRALAAAEAEDTQELLRVLSPESLAAEAGKEARPSTTNTQTFIRNTLAAKEIDKPEEVATINNMFTEAIDAMYPQGASRSQQEKIMRELTEEGFIDGWWIFDSGKPLWQWYADMSVDQRDNIRNRLIQAGVSNPTALDIAKVAYNESK